MGEVLAAPNPVVLDDEATVLRALSAVRFVPPGQSFPMSDAFQPSSPEKKDALDQGLPVRVSVFDAARTTPEQAISFRPLGPAYVVFGLRVDDVSHVAIMLARPSLRVVRDPAPYISGPGADGHCGIEGLDSGGGKKQAKLAARAAQDELARKCSKVYPAEDTAPQAVP
jgi:hypothetical protein